jgi:putative effector of murein hydrolase
MTQTETDANGTMMMMSLTSTMRFLLLLVLSSFFICQHPSSAYAINNPKDVRLHRIITTNTRLSQRVQRQKISSFKALISPRPSSLIQIIRLGLDSASKSTVEGNGNDDKVIRPKSSILTVTDIKAIVSAIAFIIIDIFFRRIFQYCNIAFPSSLGACGTLFLSLLVLPQKQQQYKYIPFLNPTSWASFLQPGATLFAKWLPVFFVPSLITLPLTDSIGTSIEIMKITSIVVIGFFFTLLSTSYSVTALRYLLKTTTTTTTPTVATSTGIVATPTTSSSATSAKVFSDVLFYMLCGSTMCTGLAAIVTKHSVQHTLWTSLFLLSTTLNTFVFGARLPTNFKKVVHPLVTCTTLTWFIIAALAAILPNRNFYTILKSYKTGRLTSMTTSGPGDVLLFLLGPAVVSLAISMYEKRLLMKQNLIELCTAISVSTLGGLYGTALMVRCFNIASPYLRLSLLSRNITSPLAMAIAGILGADVSLAVTMVVVTGLIGANFGAAILNLFGIHDAVARGLGIGAAAHGLGTAAFANEKDAFPFAAISMALTASAATVAVSIPIVRKSLVQLALGA